MRLLILLLLISSCSLSIEREKPKDKIIIEELEPIQDTKVNCNAKDLTKLEITKCKMHVRLLELKY